MKRQRFQYKSVALKNEYEIRGEVSALFMRRKDGSRLQTLVDTEDLERIGALNVCWGAIWNSKSQTSYARGYVPELKSKYVLLHRFVVNAQGEFLVDHIDHNGLNNRKQNLRIITCSENLLNRRGATARSKSGIRGVRECYDGKWIASIKIQGRSRHLGVFGHKELAEQAFKSALQSRIFPEKKRGTIYWDKERHRWSAQVRLGSQHLALGRFLEKDQAQEALAQFLRENLSANT